MFPWKYNTIHPLDVLPRQFEYHPNFEDVILYGTQDARVGIISTSTKKVTPLGIFGKDHYDPILGLCWLRQDVSKFVVGSSHGILKYAELPLDPSPGATALTHSYEDFPHLSSVHINSNDTQLLVSGTSKDVTIYDLKTGQKTLEMSRIHKDSINISRFSNHSPNLLATCSFDSTIKLWDMRARYTTGPIQSMTTEKAIVMVNFSPNDALILSSGSDNEVHQFFVANGEKDLSYDVPKRYSSVNFTRAYYSSSGQFVATGGSEEDCLNLLSSATGSMICNMPVSPDYFPSPYIQSLRPCPKNDNFLTALVNDRVLSLRQLVHVEITSTDVSEATNCRPHSYALSSTDSTHSTSYDLALRDAPKKDGCMDEVEIQLHDEITSLLPPTEEYTNRLDKLWFSCIDGSTCFATPQGGWRDGLIYLTYSLSGTRHLSSQLHSGPSWSVHCTRQVKEKWKQSFSMCVAVYPAVICARNSVLGDVILSSIQSACESTGSAKSACSCSANCSSQVLAVSLESVVLLKSVVEISVFSNALLRYMYSSVISVDVLMKLSVGVTDGGALDESCDAFLGSSEFDTLRKQTDDYANKLLDILSVVIRLARDLCIEELLLHTDCVIGSLVRMHTVLKIMNLAVKYDRTQLVDACKRFLAANFELVYKNCTLLVSDTHRFEVGVILQFLKAVELMPLGMLRHANICIDIAIVSGEVSRSLCPGAATSILTAADWVEILTDMCRLFDSFEPREMSKDNSVAHSLASASSYDKDTSPDSNLERSAASHPFLRLIQGIAAGVTSSTSAHISDGSLATSGRNSVSSFDEELRSSENSGRARREEVDPFSIVSRASHNFYFDDENDHADLDDIIAGNAKFFGPHAVEVKIPLVFDHSVVRIFNDLLLHFGGRNNYTMFGNDMLLAYYPAQSEWKYLQTFGDTPLSLNTAIALPLQSTHTRDILLIDDKYGKWKFSVLDCRSMMWRTVNATRETTQALCKRHRATIAAIPLRDGADLGYDHTLSSSQWSYVVVWGGYCFDSQRPKNDLWVVKILPRTSDVIESEPPSPSVVGLPREEAMAAGDDADDDSTDAPLGGLMRGQVDSPALLSRVKSTSVNMNLPQIRRLVGSLAFTEDLELTCSQPLITGRTPAARWGASSALLYTPTGVRLIVHGGVGQIDGLVQNEVFSLRCGNPAAMQWETVRSAGVGPGNRYGHSMSSCSNGVILLYGGCVLNSEWRFGEDESNKIWCLEYVTSDLHSISLRWSSICPEIPAPLRMKHTASVWSKSRDTHQLIVFGGVRQSGGINGDICIVERGARRFDITFPDAVVEMAECEQKLVFVNGTPPLVRSQSVIQDNILQLMLKPELSDLTMRVRKFGMDVQEESDSNDTSCSLLAHSAIVGMHASSLSSAVDWARSSTSENGMMSEQKTFFLDLDICGDIATARCFLEYLYGGKPVIDAETVLQMAAVADLYGVDALYKHCEGFLLHFLSASNAFDILFYISESFAFSKMSSLRSTAINIIASNIEEFRDTPEFDLLPDGIKLEIEAKILIV